jgi:flagellar basal body P-ring formation protein FlgA
MRILFALAFALAAGSAAADTIVTSDAISSRIAEAITKRLPTSGHYKVALADPSYQLTLSGSQSYDIAALTFDPSRQTFDATLGYVSAAGEKEYVRLGGSALAVIEVPTLMRDIAAGEVIAAGDLGTLEIPVQRRSSNLIGDANTVVGQVARRPLRANAPLFAYDVQKAVVVKKGDVVTVSFAVAGLELTMQGQAQNDAGKGDTVTIRNANSRRVVEARVTGAGAATIITPATLAAR